MSTLEAFHLILLWAKSLYTHTFENGNILNVHNMHSLRCFVLIRTFQYVEYMLFFSEL